MSAQPETQWFLRPMTLNDIPGVIQVEEAAYDYPWTPGVFEDCVRAGYHTWVAEDRNGALVGHGLMTAAVGEAHLLNLCIDPRMQHCGLGLAFMNHLISVARGEGVSLMFLEVRPSNRAARGLYRKLGFREAGHRRDYYPAIGGREDAVVLVRDF